MSSPLPRRSVPLFDRETLYAQSRKGKKALAHALLPSALVVWGGSPPGTNPGDRRIALTFDDGPGPLTRDYLAVLERFEARATFFVVGEYCERHPDLVKAMAASGHELAGHGYTHSRFNELSFRELRDELARTRELLPPSPSRRTLVRPPHGALSLSSIIACACLRYTLVLWSFDSGDWRTERAEDVVRAFDQELEPGAIVLLHEGQPWTLEALPEVLASLKRAGHEFVTVGDLLA